MSSSRSRRILIVLVLLVLLLLLLFFARCTHKTAPADPAPAVSLDAPNGEPQPTLKEVAPAQVIPEKLTPATLRTEPSVIAGAVFSVEWTGPNNPDDYVTIVTVDAPPNASQSYAPAKAGPKVELTAPITPGKFELRYVTSRSKTILGRAPILVSPAEAAVAAPKQAVLGSVIPVTWSGPNNAGDFVTIVPKALPDGRYSNYTYTNKGSPLEATVPIEAGEAEVRYMTGQGNRVLARTPLTIVAPRVKLSAAREAVAGSLLSVEWEGPKNAGDYLTVVLKKTPDGQYATTAYLAGGSPAKVLVPMDTGDAEVRYMTGQGNKVLGRRELIITAPQVTLSAPAEIVAGSEVEVSWTGPQNSGDYITIVARSAKDGSYGNNTPIASGSPLKVLAPMDASEAEIRYMSGAGARVLGRRGIQIVNAKVALDAPARAVAGSAVQVAWTGPGNGGDYIVIAPKDAPDSQAEHYASLGRATSVSVVTPTKAGPAEIRYVSGQGRKVLARRPLDIEAK